MRRCVPSKRLEAFTRPYGATTQNTRLLNTKTGLQMIKFFSTGSFPVGRAACFPQNLNRVFRFNLLSLSLSRFFFSKTTSRFGRMSWRIEMDFGSAENKHLPASLSKMARAGFKR